MLATSCSPVVSHHPLGLLLSENDVVLKSGETEIGFSEKKICSWLTQFTSWLNML
jgi:hypothetical protein